VDEAKASPFLQSSRRSLVLAVHIWMDITERYSDFVRAVHTVQVAGITGLWLLGSFFFRHFISVSSPLRRLPPWTASLGFGDVWHVSAIEGGECNRRWRVSAIEGGGGEWQLGNSEGAFSVYRTAGRQGGWATAKVC
jgi:hypothetical protein